MTGGLSVRGDLYWSIHLVLLHLPFQNMLIYLLIAEQGAWLYTLVLIKTKNLPAVFSLVCLSLPGEL